MININHDGISIRIRKKMLHYNDLKIEIPKYISTDSVRVIDGEVFLGNWKYNPELNQFEDVSVTKKIKKSYGSLFKKILHSVLK